MSKEGLPRQQKFAPEVQKKARKTGIRYALGTTIAFLVVVAFLYSMTIHRVENRVHTKEFKNLSSASASYSEHLEKYREELTQFTKLNEVIEFVKSPDSVNTDKFQALKTFLLSTNPAISSLTISHRTNNPEKVLTKEFLPDGVILRTSFMKDSIPFLLEATLKPSLVLDPGHHVEFKNGFLLLKEKDGFIALSEAFPTDSILALTPTEPLPFQETETHFIYTKRFNLNATDSSSNIYLGVLTSTDTIGKEATITNLAFGLSLLLLVPLMISLGWWLGNYRVKNNWYMEHLHEMAIRDTMTGLLNHGAVMELLKADMQRSKRNTTPLSVVFVDINDLKATNDSFGHEAGDILIQGVAQAMKDTLRSSDSIGRMGGDEFLMVLPDCEEKSILPLMFRIQTRIQELGTSFPGPPWTISWGNAEYRSGDITAEQLIYEADMNMYKRKQKHKKIKKTHEKAKNAGNS